MTEMFKVIREIEQAEDNDELQKIFWKVKQRISHERIYYLINQCYRKKAYELTPEPTQTAEQVKQVLYPEAKVEVDQKPMKEHPNKESLSYLIRGQLVKDNNQVSDCIAADNLKKAEEILNEACDLFMEHHGHKELKDQDSYITEEEGRGAVDRVLL